MLKGKAAIVTGSTSGIGLGIATALAAEGCNLVLNGFGDAGGIEKERAHPAEKNRGIQFVAPIEDFPEDKWDSIIAINLSASFHAIKAAVPGMVKRRWGRIV